jgi:hypothetical protein
LKSDLRAETFYKSRFPQLLTLNSDESSKRGGWIDTTSQENERVEHGRTTNGTELLVKSKTED